jgi:hypothetical protein
VPVQLRSVPVDARPGAYTGTGYDLGHEYCDAITGCSSANIRPHTSAQLCCSELCSTVGWDAGPAHVGNGNSDSAAILERPAPACRIACKCCQFG